MLALVLLLAALLPTEPPLLLDPYCCWIPMTLQAATVLLTVILAAEAAVHPVLAVHASGAAVVHLPVVDPLLRVVRDKVVPWLHATWLVGSGGHLG